MRESLRIAVLVKQIPAPMQLRMTEGRVVRRGMDLEVNAYCRRANAKAVELANPDGEVVIFTMGPPSAEDALREMIACGADRGVHLCDRVLAGSDTLATAMALAAALKREGPFHLVLAGLNSLDSETGQVPAEVAELLRLPFAAGVHDLEIAELSDDETSEHSANKRSSLDREATTDRNTGTKRTLCFRARLETDDGYRTVTGYLPVLLSTAERLCYPSKAPPEQRRAVPGHHISRLTAADLGVAADRLGIVGSPTSVGPVRSLRIKRNPRRATNAGEVVDSLVDLGVLAPADTANTDTTTNDTNTDTTTNDTNTDTTTNDTNTSTTTTTEVMRGEETVQTPGEMPDTSATADGTAPEVWCFFTAASIGAELLNVAAELAGSIDGTVTAVTTEATISTGPHLGAIGADKVLVIPSTRPGQPSEPAEQADALAAAAAAELPWALLVEGTRSGRSVASAVAARHGWGLTSDAIELEIDDDNRLVAWKPAFSGQLKVPIRSRSRVQMVTIRPGALPCSSYRTHEFTPRVCLLPTPAPAPIRTIAEHRDECDIRELHRSAAVVALGQGIDPSGYPVIEGLRAALGGAALGATRKVTDRGWLPRGLQIGVTGHFVAPRLLVAVGSSGRFNHTVGIRNAHAILAVNSDSKAEIFDQADVGIVGTWQQIVPQLTAELQVRSLTVVGTAIR